MQSMYVSFYDADKAPYLAFQRNGDKMYLDFTYDLLGNGDFTGDLSITIGKKTYSDFTIDGPDPTIGLSGGFSIKADTRFSVSYEINDGFDNSALTRSFWLTRMESSTHYQPTAGLDLVFGSQGADRINGGGAHDFLNGWKGQDKIFGGDGHDHLDGGEGHDLLHGGKGDDQFFFTTKFRHEDSDKIQDFRLGDDSIWLSEGIFLSISNKYADPAGLFGGYFRQNTTGIAQDHNDHIIYEKDTGEIYYDKDGKGGLEGILVAELDPGTKFGLEAILVF